MFADGFFPDRFDLYRSVTKTSATGERSRSYPYVATQASKPCLFSWGRGRFTQLEQGLEIDHDAELRCSTSIDIQPDTRGEDPDKIVITKHAGEDISLAFAAVWVQNNYGKYQTVYLREIS